MVLFGNDSLFYWACITHYFLTGVFVVVKTNVFARKDHMTKYGIDDMSRRSESNRVQRICLYWPARW